MDREPLNSECLSGLPREAIFNCWIYFTTFIGQRHRGGVNTGFCFEENQPVHNREEVRKNRDFHVFELEVRLKLTSRSVSVMIQKCTISETPKLI